MLRISITDCALFRGDLVKVGDMDVNMLKIVVRDENTKSNRELKHEFYKHLEKNYMSKGDCLSIHQGRNSAHEVSKGNGELKRAKAKFWLSVAGLMTAVSLMIGAITFMIYNGVS